MERTRSASSIDESITSAPELDSWSSENLEDLRQLLTCTSMELASARQAARSQEQMYTAKLTHLEELLLATQKERDEARKKTFDQSAAAAAPSWEDFPDSSTDYSFLLNDVVVDATHNDATDDAVVLDLTAASPPLDAADAADAAAAAAAAFFHDDPVKLSTIPSSNAAAVAEDLEAKMAGELPQRGHLLEAVMQAGPLLQHLMLASAPPRAPQVPHLPLPRWHRPPPASFMPSFQIPQPCGGGFGSV